MVSKPHKELVVYKGLVNAGYDCWLPAEPRFHRIPHSKAVRQVWAPVLPGMFFAKIGWWARTLVGSMTDSEGVLVDANGETVRVEDRVVGEFRRHIEAQNRDLFLLGVHAQAKTNKPQVRRVKRSKRLKGSERLKTYVAGVMKDGRIDNRA